MADILVSATIEDRETAERLSRLFEARGLSVDWMPLDPLEPGNRAGIVRRRANARVTLAVWSKHSINDPQVLEDAREALRRGSLLAARVEDLIAPPEFRATATANLTGWDGDPSHIQAGRLLTETAKLLERTSTRPALALATARLNRPRGPGGATAAALRPTAQLGAAPAWPDAIANANRPAASAAPEVKSATAPAAYQQPEIKSEPVVAKTLEQAPQSVEETASPAVTVTLSLTPAAVKTASDAAEEKLEPQPASVMFAGEAANDALPLQPANVTVSETEPSEPTYQTFTFEPEPRPQAEPMAEPQPSAAPEPAPAAVWRETNARVVTPAPEWRDKTGRARKPAPERTPFLREPRERTERDDRNHYLAMLIGVVVSIAFLALWFQQRPQDFSAPSSPKPVIEAAAERPAAADETAAPVIADAPEPTAADSAPEIDIASDLPLIQPAPILPQVEPAAPSTHAMDAPAAPPVFAQAPVAESPAASAPAAAKSPALDPAPAIKAKAQAFAEAPRAVRKPAPAKAKAAAGAAAPSAKAQRMAEVGRALDARAAAPSATRSSPTIAALAGAPPAVAPVALTSSVFDPTPSLTVLRLAEGGHAFHLPGLAPSMLGAWTPGADAPAPTLTIPVTDAEWNSAPARRLAQTALSTGDYKDHLAKAQDGERRAMLILGLMRQTGIGEAQDDARAFAWLRRAALAGDARALSEIGAYYAAGIGAVRDDDRAVRNFDRSAMLGAATGKNSIGWALATGRGLPADAAKARLAFEDSAAAGDPLAALNLGRMQADGLGGARDPAAAKLSYAKAADQGFAPAQYALAVLLLADLPAGADEAAMTARTQAATLAALRVQQAAAQGYPPAGELLGALYLNGIGVTQDPAMARAWFERIPQS